MSTKKGQVKYKKAPQAPRRFKSSYMFFSTEKHKSIRQELIEKGETDKVRTIFPDMRLILNGVVGAVFPMSNILLLPVVACLYSSPLPKWQSWYHRLGKIFQKTRRKNGRNWLGKIKPATKWKSPTTRGPGRCPRSAGRRNIPMHRSARCQLSYHFQTQNVHM